MTSHATRTHPRTPPYSVHGPLPLHVYLADRSLRAVLAACLVSLAITCGALAIAHLAFGISFSGPLPLIAVACVVCLFTLMISFHRIMQSSKRLAQPLEQLAKEAGIIAQGTFDVRIDDSYKDLGVNEVTDLIDSFNAMAKALASMDHMQRDFTSSVSHEFKTPIAAITGICELVRDPKLPEDERREYLDLMHEQAVRLSKLCDSVLAISRLDAQESVTRWQTCDIDEQIRRDVIMLSERWAQRDIALDLDLQAPAIETDPDLAHQIWINLIDNAYKYTPDGGTVGIATCAVPGGVQAVVRDTGRGMTADETAHAFDRFYQANRSHAEEGTGLGLSIVKRICELLGGRISCKSAPGAGTTMTVFLPNA